MKECIGVDFHKQRSFVTRMDAGGTIVEQRSLKNSDEELGAFLRGHVPNARIAVEATGNWYHFYEMIEDLNPDVVLSHPLKTKAIASARIKTDKIDSATLAHLLRADLLPTAYIPPRHVRDWRETLRHRAALVAQATMVKNRIHAVLSKNGVRIPYSNYFGKGGATTIRSLDLRPCYRHELSVDLQLLETFKELIKTIDERIVSLANDDPRAALLTTLPGIGHYSALLILAEIGDIARFPDAAHLCSYAGLVPSTRASADKVHHGRITKQGSSWLRWILVQASMHAQRHPAFRQRFERIAQRKGKSTARVATARHLLTITYAMLSKNRPFAHPMEH